MKYSKIKHKKDTEMTKTTIIAEIGINHNGDIEIAKRLIKASKDAGADIVKFQKRDINSTYSQEELDKPRETPFGKTNRDLKLALEFGEAEYDEIDEYCQQVGIDWMVSCWDLPSVEFMKQYDLKYNKIASALLTHKELLTAIAKEKKHTFISTGMSTVQEIEQALMIFENYKCPVTLLHCNSQYPMPDAQANLKCIQFMKEHFLCPIGYSCHSTGVVSPSLAVTLGASVIEKHITLDRSMWGSDQSASVEPDGFKRMVDYIRLAEISVGDGHKVVYAGEEPIKKKLRREKDFK